MTSKTVVGPLPTIRFHDGTRVAYEPPRDTCDPRHAACNEHHPACDCREAEHREEMAEHRGEWELLCGAAARALSGHQVTYPPGLSAAERLRFPLCLCSGCVIHREARTLLPIRAIDFNTGRVR